MPRAILWIVAQSGKQPKYPEIGKQIVIYSYREYHLTIKTAEPHNEKYFIEQTKPDPKEYIPYNSFI